MTWWLTNVDIESHMRPCVCGEDVGWLVIITPAEQISWLDKAKTQTIQLDLAAAKRECVSF